MLKLSLTLVAFLTAIALAKVVATVEVFDEGGATVVAKWVAKAGHDFD